MIDLVNGKWNKVYYFQLNRRNAIRNGNGVCLDVQVPEMYGKFVKNKGILVWMNGIIENGCNWVVNDHYIIDLNFLVKCWWQMVSFKKSAKVFGKASSVEWCCDAGISVLLNRSDVCEHWCRTSLSILSIMSTVNRWHWQTLMLML